MKRTIVSVAAIMVCLCLWPFLARALPEDEVARLGTESMDVVCNSVAFSPDGGMLAAGTSIGIYLYDPFTFAEIGFIESAVPINSVAFSPDSRLLASGSEDRTVKLWDVSSHKEVATLKGHTDWVFSVAFSPDGRLLASGSADSTVWLWDMEPYINIPDVVGPEDKLAVSWGGVKNEEYSFSLRQNYPNPFNPETWIPYQLAKDANVIIRIYDSTGRLIQVLDLGRKPAGRYVDKGKAAYWDGRNSLGERSKSGVYFYTIHAGDFFTATRKMMIAR